MTLSLCFLKLDAYGLYFSVYHVSAFALFACVLNVKNFSSDFHGLDVLFLSIVIGRMMKHFLYFSHVFAWG